MRFNYRKIASVFASAVMLTSTMGFAAAATYPAPFSSTGGVVVYGADAAKNDLVSAISVQSSITATTTGVAATATCVGECAPLYTGSSKININDTMNVVKTVLTETELPTVLKRSTFNGNIDSIITQKIDIGINPVLTYAKQPTTSDDPDLGFDLSTSSADYIYNATASFSPALNLTHADSKNREIELFGQKFTIGSATDSSNIVLYKSSSTLYFDSSGVTSEEATIDGKTYTIELISASTTTATIKVTNEAGGVMQQQVNVGGSRNINGITIATITADSNSLKYTASISAGADKITLATGSAVSIGDSSTSIEGTLVTFVGTPANLTKLVIGVFAENDEKDALKSGGELIDPLFGTFKVSMNGGYNIPTAVNDTSRESLTLQSSGDDKLQVKFTNWQGKEGTISFIKTRLGLDPELQWGDDGMNITVVEGGVVYKNEYVVVGNQENGYLLKVGMTHNSDYTKDKVIFTNVFDTSETFTSISPSSEGVTSVNIGGVEYGLRYYDNNTGNQNNWNISMDYPDSTSTASLAGLIVYPTIQTSKGAKAFFYKPLTINVADYVYEDNTTGANVTKLKFPNGNGYTSFDIAVLDDYNTSVTNTGGALIGNASILQGVNLTVGNLKYNLYGAPSALKINLLNPNTAANISYPAFGIIEEKDDNTAYNAVIVTSLAGAASTNATRVNSILRTWSSDNTFNTVSWYSNSNKASEIDLFGTIGAKDSGDSNHPKVELSYPDEQIYANLFITKSDAVITPGGTAGGASGGLTVIEDSVVESYKDSNMIVVGGSCVNEAALKILDPEGTDPICGADFTLKTDVGATQYIIKTVKSPYNAEKIAVLVAGYEAADTASAVTTLLGGANTDVDSSQVYPILATS